MESIRINGKRYTIKTEWGDLTTAEVDSLAAIEAPSIYLDLIKGTEKEPTEYEVTVAIPDYYRRVMAELSTVPLAIFTIMTWQQVSALFKLVEPLIIEFHSQSFETATEVKRYYRTGAKVLRPIAMINGVPSPDVTAEMVLQAQDVIAAGIQNWRFIPFIYNGWSEKRILKHRRQLKFTVVLAFFFSIWKSLHTFAVRSRSAFGLEKERRLRASAVADLFTNLRLAGLAASRN